MQNLYHRNRRRRSSKDVPKGMQNLHRKLNGEHQKINGEEGSKDVPKGMQSLCVPMWVCVFGISVILHHIITSFRIASHHTSYRINDTRIEHGVDPRRTLRKFENVLRHEADFEKYSFISLVTKEGIPFCEEGIFLRSMDLFLYEACKEGKVFFRRMLKTGMYIKFHASQRNELQ
jgi:hypothetical protein